MSPYEPMKIQVNGATAQLPHPLSIQDALQHLGIELPARAALALNGQVIPRAQLATQCLQEGDTILLISPTFGG